MDSLACSVGTKPLSREEQRLARLRSNAQQTPVIAQRPVAPIKQEMSDARSNDDLTMTTMSDNGGIISTTNASSSNSNST